MNAASSQLAGRQRVLVLASLYNAQHVEQMRPYQRINPVASPWNTALFAELRKLNVELHIVQFYPVWRAHVLREGNVTFYYLPRIPKLDGFTSFFKRMRVRRLARQLNPDVIHGIGSEHGYAWAVVHDRWPSVVTIHGYLRFINRLSGHRSLLKRLFLEREEHRAMRRCRTLIAINEYMRDQFIQDGCSADRISVVANALNPIYLDACAGAKRDIDVLMVGTIHPLKNHRLALEMFTALRDAGRSLSVLVAGAPTAVSRDYHAGLLHYKAEHRLDNVEFAGAVDPVRLREFYCRSKILLHISQFEADPTVVAEALACGVIPVVNPVAGLAYRVRHGVNGYHLDISDPAQASAGLAEVVDRYETAKELAEHGRALVVDQRSPKQVARLTFEVYSRTVFTRTGIGLGSGWSKKVEGGQ